MKYVLKNDNLRAEIDGAGAQLVSVIYKGKERLWQNDNGSWSGHAPVLFPLCGNCAMTVGGKTYGGMPRHGFASGKTFELANKTDGRVRLALKSDENTRAVYPFEFAFFVEYELTGNGIRITYEVEPTGGEPVPFACGGHESYALDGRLSEYKIVFDKDEEFTALLHDDEGRLTGETLAFGRGRELILPEKFLDGTTVILGGIASRSVELCARDGKPIAKTSFDGFGNLLLWRPRDARMICIEPWSNLPDTVGERKEFADKSGVFMADKTVKLVRTVEYF